jgi:hypothetical protein
VRDPRGYAVIIDPTASRLTQEHDVITCIHCGNVQMTRGQSGALECMVFRADGTHYFRAAGFCRNCYRHVCPVCDGKPCTNRFRLMDEEEKWARKRIILP